ncbi:MAG: aminotransferase class V-fold PLP-dependent enzyme, partial [Methanosarcinales archaeon]|nr:aminotransferase class V-fold PLP-dependent enzyme [Methanosarcinales archaeon]
GSHERKMRAGTENVSGIVGFAEACKLYNDNLAEEAAHMTQLRDRLIDGLLKIDDSYLNGSHNQRLPNNANVRFSFIEGEGMLLLLDMNGISVSTGSACSSASLEPSHVLSAIGLKPEDSHGSLRFSLGRANTQAEIDYVLEIMPGIVEKLRAMSPLKKS